VAGGKLRQETSDNVTDGLQLLQRNVLLLVLGALKSSSLKVLVHYRAPFVNGDVHV
jgi:hypothetical protein